MDIHNFIQRPRVVNEAFMRAKTNPAIAKVELPNEGEKILVEINATDMLRSECDYLCDYIVNKNAICLYVHAKFFSFVIST